MEASELQIDFRSHFRMLRAVLVWSGEILLYLAFVMPFAVDQHLALISLEMPSQAILFGTVWPYYSVVELLGMFIAIGLFLTGARHAFSRNRIVVVYFIINLCAIAALPLITPSGEPVY